MPFDFEPLWLSIELAAITVAILLGIGTPIAWWLARTRSRLRVAVEAVVALPLVLPPTVLGFYLLLMLGPDGPLGGLLVSVTGSSLTFSFEGLVLASAIYSLPFVVQPVQGAFEAVGRGPLEAAFALRARALDAFFTVAVPMARRGFITGACSASRTPSGSSGWSSWWGATSPGRRASSRSRSSSTSRH